MGEILLTIKIGSDFIFPAKITIEDDHRAEDSEKKKAEEEARKKAEEQLKKEKLELKEWRI